MKKIKFDIDIDRCHVTRVRGTWENGASKHVTWKKGPRRKSNLKFITLILKSPHLKATPLWHCQINKSLLLFILVHFSLSLSQPPPSLFHFSPSFSKTLFFSPVLLGLGFYSILINAPSFLRFSQDLLFRIFCLSFFSFFIPNLDLWMPAREEDLNMDLTPMVDTRNLDKVCSFFFSPLSFCLFYTLNMHALPCTLTFKLILAYSVLCLLCCCILCNLMFFFRKKFH